MHNNALGRALHNSQNLRKPRCSSTVGHSSTGIPPSSRILCTSEKVHIIAMSNETEASHRDIIELKKSGAADKRVDNTEFICKNYTIETDVRTVISLAWQRVEGA